MVSQVAIQDGALVAEHAQMRELLRTLEWSANVVYELGGHRGYGVSLPACIVCRNFKSRGHVSSCPLAAILTPAKSV